MKRIAFLLLAFSTLYSCQITERIYLAESGSVRYESEINFSEMMGFMINEKNIDSLKLVGQFPLDTILSLQEADGFQNSSSEKPSKEELNFLKSLDKTKIRLVMNENDGKMVLVTEEKDISSLNAYLKNANKYLKEYEKFDKDKSEKLSNGAYMSILELKNDGKTFERKSLSEKVNLDELSDSTTISTKDMFGMFGYKLEYHFPKKVKSTTLEGATISPDGKTVTADVDYLEVIQNPSKFDFKVEFE